MQETTQSKLFSSWSSIYTINFIVSFSFFWTIIFFSNNIFCHKQFLLNCSIGSLLSVRPFTSFFSVLNLYYMYLFVNKRNIEFPFKRKLVQVFFYYFNTSNSIGSFQIQSTLLNEFQTYHIFYSFYMSAFDSFHYSAYLLMYFCICAA